MACYVLRNGAIHMNYNQVKELIGMIEGTDFTSFSLNFDGVSIAIERGQGVEKAAVAPTDFVEARSEESRQAAPVEKNTAEEVAERSQGNYVKSPIVGTFYASPTPDQPAFVQVGDKVKKGDVLCIVEAMKFMNEIASEFDGTVEEILAEDQAMVEYGQPLFRIV